MSYELHLDLTTPRPWSVNHGSVSTITSEDGQTEVCEIDCSYEEGQAAVGAHADADLIVQAVNERAALLTERSAYLSLRTELAHIFGPVTPREGQTWNEAMLARITEKLVADGR